MDGLYMTDAVKRRIFEDEKFSHFVFKCLRKFLNEDWGDLDDEEKELNREAWKNGKIIKGLYNFDSEGEDRVVIVADAEDKEGKRVVTVGLAMEGL